MRCKAVFLANDKGRPDTLKTNSPDTMRGPQLGGFETRSPAGRALSGPWTGQL